MWACVCRVWVCVCACVRLYLGTACQAFLLSHESFSLSISLCIVFWFFSCCLFVGCVQVVPFCKNSIIARDTQRLAKNGNTPLTGNVTSSQSTILQPSCIWWLKVSQISCPTQDHMHLSVVAMTSHCTIQYTLFSPTGTFFLHPLHLYIRTLHTL